VRSVAITSLLEAQMTPRWPRLAVLTLLPMILAVGPSNAADPIRIGYIGPLTGIFAQAGKDMLDGLKLALEQANDEAAGRKIELIAEDSEGNPATALAKYRKLTTHDRIHVLDGVLLSHIGYGLVQPHREHLHPQGRSRGRQAREHRAPHLPARLPVLDVRRRGFPQDARVHPRLPTSETVRRPCE
jgi:hypothetical protein